MFRSCGRDKADGEMVVAVSDTQATDRRTDGWMDDSTRLVNVLITCPGETGGGG